MKKILLILASILLVWFGVKKLVYSLASAETQIRWRLEEMVEGFNETRKRSVMAGFDRTYADARGYTRDEVSRYLSHLCLGYIDSETKKFTLSVSMPESELLIEIHETEPPTATVQARFLIMEGTEEYWDLSLTGDLEDDEDGWQFVRTRDVNHADRARR